MLEIICYITTIAVNLVLLAICGALGIAYYLKQKRTKSALERFRGRSAK